MKKILLLGAFLVGFVFCQAQEEQQSSSSVSGTKSMFEVGLHAGVPFVGGEVSPQFGYGGGIHVRIPLDHMFALRVDGLYAMAKGEQTGPARQFDNKWISGALFGVLTLNNMRFDRPIRKTNVYILGGAGYSSMEVTYTRSDEPRTPNPRTVKSNNPYVAAGAGIAFRLSKRMNIGIEHITGLVPGANADQLDGIIRTGGERTAFGDSFNYTNLRFNFNIGGGSKSEPLYWVNPFEIALADISKKANSRADLAISDSDGDGVIDVLDQEPDTAPDAIVDTKGRTLDSDRDGVPDHQDMEPYYTPRPGERINNQGVVENPIVGGGVTEERVIELIDQRLNQFEQNITNQGAQTTNVNSSAAMANLFLPMVHFSSASDVIKYSDYGTLASIARVIKGTPDLRIAVIGYTDQTGDEATNNELSYNRALAVISHLVNNHGISRGRLVLMWKGQEEALVPATSSYMNRRVEFRVAGPNDIEQDPPSMDFDGNGN
jgi:OOP family OmpA-OmpF porin